MDDISGGREMLSIETNNEIWKNWSASVICETERFLRPKKLSELVQIVKEHHKQNRKIRVVGSGHSFTPLVATDETLISIEHLAGIDHVDKENDIEIGRASCRERGRMTV